MCFYPKSDSNYEKSLVQFTTRFIQLKREITMYYVTGSNSNEMHMSLAENMTSVSHGL